MPVALRMGEPRPAKKEIVEFLHQRLEKAEGVLLLDFEKVKVSEDRKFRRKMEELGVTVKVVKNSLARRAIQGTPFEALLLPHFVRPTMILLVQEDLPRVARELKTLLDAGEFPFAFKGGAIPGRAFDAKGIAEIAALPTRKELVTRLALGLRSPVVRLARTLATPLQRLAFALRALEHKKQSS